ncbi:hypothetical protein Mpt1_c06110 [Candidatus Methanoplasma termitum]|uniref:Uncharacterized protein n=1 Tax=Candidatus Methanoplasma termitum TaxID=1577791 RepID=A0A0A7LBW0_9ARCH|nr:hypothetical protein [Candidatus Methanoplasma termitum]AIZ56498.1 hypothetical protein Mpt1_c06110 [Candidatus Methanoplasma termitum]MCL2333234.1 hypothetical protein [Candidatus Methanoplasma sp.]
MSNECKVTVDAGVCKMKTVVVAKANPDTGMIDLVIESDCPHVLKMSWSLQPICPYTEVEAAMNQTEVYKMASEALPHAACPVPCGMIKAVEVAGDLGLKRDVVIKVE